MKEHQSPEDIDPEEEEIQKFLSDQEEQMKALKKILNEIQKSTNSN